MTRLSDPAPNRVPAAVIADHLVVGIDGTATAGVADDAAATVRLCHRDCNGECADGGDENEECSFHGVEFVVRGI